MRALRMFSLAGLVTGAGAIIGGVTWWALSYWQVWTNDYLSLPQAGRCLVADSSICRLATALCTGQHRSIAATYSPWIMWLGLAALVCGASPLTMARVSQRRTSNLKA